MWATRLQWAFIIMAGLFDWIGLHTNIGKSVIMAYQPCHAIGGHSVEPYGLRMTVDHLIMSEY